MGVDGKFLNVTYCWHISVTKCSKVIIYSYLQFFLGETLVLQSAGDARESWREVFIHFCDSLEWFFTRYLELWLGWTKQDLWGLGAEARIVYCSKLSFCQNDSLIGSSLGAIFILRKGKGVSGWYSKILTIPYMGRWVVLDHPYVRKKGCNHSLSQLPLK